MKSVFINADWNPLMIGKQDILHWLDFLLPFLLQLLQFFYEGGRGARKYNAWRSFAHFKHCKKKKRFGYEETFFKMLKISEELKRRLYSVWMGGLPLLSMKAIASTCNCPPGNHFRAINSGKLSWLRIQRSIHLFIRLT